METFSGCDCPKLNKLEPCCDPAPPLLLLPPPKLNKLEDCCGCCPKPNEPFACWVCGGCDDPNPNDVFCCGCDCPNPNVVDGCDDAPKLNELDDWSDPFDPNEV